MAKKSNHDFGHLNLLSKLQIDLMLHILQQTFNYMKLLALNLTFNNKCSTNAIHTLLLDYMFQKKVI